MWTDKEKHIFPYELKELPEVASKELLEKYLLKKDFYLIPKIIKSTGCIPIYLNLALDIYQLSYRDKLACINDSMFPDKGSLVNKFINHLPKAYQEIILVLGLVKIFDNNIFEYMVKELNISFPIHKFEDLCNTTLVNYVENIADFYKFHDIFAENIIRVHSDYEISKTFQIYLKFISTQGVFLYSDGQIIALFLNILEHYNKISINSKFEIEINEMIIKIFLSLISRKARFDLPNIQLEISKLTSYNDVRLFIYAVLYEKIDTTHTINLLSKIQNPECFGKQRISYELVNSYCNSLVGKYDKFGKTVKKINDELTLSDIGEWYYTRTKYYLSDYYLIKGDFYSAYQNSLNTINEYENMPLGDLYYFKRNIGHIQRFNLLIDQAINTYQNLLTLHKDNINLQVYILTNICETACYFDNDIFCEYIEKAFSIGKLLKSKKNIAKLYYSNAIFLLRKKLYSKAQNNINISIKINQKDGYQSGILFALMAQAYLDYSVLGYIKKDTLLSIENLLMMNDVYTFFRLPIYLMQGKISKALKLKDKYNWLDFDYTLLKYKEFLTKLL